MNKEQVQGSVLEGTRRSCVFVLVGATLLLAGSVFGVDWINYFYKTGSLYPAFAKPGITLLSMVIVVSWL